MGGWAQGIFTSLIASVLIVGIPTLLTWIKNKWPQHGELVRFWLTTAAALAILLYATTGYIPFAKHEIQITPENLEENIKLWAEHLGMNIGPATESDSYFAHTLSIPNMAQPVEVFRSKEKPGYLQFKATIQVAKEHQMAFSKMSQEAIDRINEQLALDIGRANLGCSFGVLVGVDTEHHKTVIAGAFLQRVAFRHK